MERREGYVDFEATVGGKPCKIWYLTLGDVQAARPLVILHGGPGLCHDYLLSLTDLARPNRPLVFWDQVGSGKSTRLPEKLNDHGFWTEQLFLDQVSAVLVHLGIQNDYDLLGQSWGGMLAATHAAVQPAGLRRLVLSSTPFSSEMWTDAYKRYRANMPEEHRGLLAQTRTFDTPPSAAYDSAMAAFSARHFMNLDPVPDEVAASFDDVSKDSTVWMST